MAFYSLYNRRSTTRKKIRLAYKLGKNDSNVQYALESEILLTVKRVLYMCLKKLKRFLYDRNKSKARLQAAVYDLLTQPF